MRSFLFALALLISVPRSARAENDFESIFFSTSEKLVSAQVELLFEERRINDEGVDALSAPKTEPREAQLTFLGRDRWELRILLKNEDRKRNPTVTSVVMTDRDTLIALPNRSLDSSEVHLDALLPGAVGCLKDSTILSAAEIAALNPVERVAFIRSREEDAARFAGEVNAMLTEELAARIFQEEKQLGLAPAEPIARRLTVDEIVRRLVTVESLQSLERK